VQQVDEKLSDFDLQVGPRSVFPVHLDEFGQHDSLKYLLGELPLVDDQVVEEANGEGEGHSLGWRPQTGDDPDHCQHVKRDEGVVVARVVQVDGHPYQQSQVQFFHLVVLFGVSKGEQSIHDPGQYHLFLVFIQKLSYEGNFEDLEVSQVTWLHVLNLVLTVLTAQDVYSTHY
jgi:hypothetical protein